MLSWNTTPMLARSEFERDVADVDAVDADRAGIRVAQALQQGHRGALAGAGVADQRHRLAGLGDEGEVVHGRAVAAVGQADPLELDLAPARGRGIARRLLDHRRSRVEHVEELGEPRRLEEQPGDEADRLVHAADQLASRSP